MHVKIVGTSKQHRTPGTPRTRGRCIHDLQFPRDRHHVQNVLNDQLSCDQRNPIVLVSEDVDYDPDVDMIAYVRGIYRDPKYNLGSA